MENLIQLNKFSFACLSETHITKDIEQSEIIIDGYDVYRCDSYSRHTGGTLIYIKKEFKNKIICSLYCENVWMLWVNVCFNEENWIITCIYRSRQCTVSRFLEIIGEWYDTYYNSSSNIIMTGDFNINLLNKDIDEKRMQEFISDFSLKQQVKEPTRKTITSQSLIDYILTDHIVEVEVKVEPQFMISDHETICIKLQVQYRNNSKNITYLKYQKEELITLLNRKGFLDCITINSLNDCCLKFTKDLDEAFQRMKKTIILRENANKWYNNELGQMNQRKVYLYNRAVMLKNIDTWNEYKSCRNMYKYKCKEMKNNYIENQIQQRNGNQEEMWKIIKKHILKKDNTVIQVLEINNREVNKQDEIANIINEFFVDSLNEIRSSITFIPYRDTSSNINRESDFKFQLINRNTLEKTIKMMNNKSDYNGLNKKIITECQTLFFPVLEHIINKSLSDGIYPKCWRDTLIVPVPKINRAKSPIDYRPINMLTIYQKILEKIVAKQLSEFLEENKIICEEQSGFRQGHSCETAINWVINEWKKETDEGYIIVAVFIDLKRAFETIDRDVLLRKLEKIGILGIELNWFKQYLKGRKQRTKVGSFLSVLKSIEVGVPQGSVLGVLLFLIYINDLKTVIKYAKLVLFADDALLYINGKTIEECRDLISKDLENLSKWLCMNKLKLNVNKTKSMLINGGNNNVALYLNDEEIQCVVDIKYLGIHIDNKLKFDLHANYICKKISKKIGFFSRIRNKVSYDCAVILYNTLILPHYNYCSSVLFMCDNVKINRLQVLQNKAMRIILKCDRYTHIQNMLTSLNWMNVQQNIKFNVIIFVFRIKYKIYPEYLWRKLVYISDSHTFNVRNAENFRLPLYRRARSQNNVMYKGLALFNSLPSDLKAEKNLTTFKGKLSNLIINNLI